MSLYVCARACMNLEESSSVNLTTEKIETYQNPLKGNRGTIQISTTKPVIQKAKLHIALITHPYKPPKKVTKKNLLQNFLNNTSLIQKSQSLISPVNVVLPKYRRESGKKIF